MKRMILLALLFAVSMSYAATVPPLVKENRGTGVPVQGPATNPLTNYLISDNNSHTTALYPGVLWFSLNYNGAGTCQVRLMNTATKASWPQIPVQSQSSYSRIVNPKTLYLNYSGCNGVTGGNSILEMM